MNVYLKELTQEYTQYRKGLIEDLEAKGWVHETDLEVVGYISKITGSFETEAPISNTEYWDPVYRKKSR